MTTRERLQIAIIGAGPAGLTAAYSLSKAQVDVLVLEADPEHVGGISRTVMYKGFRFDIGGHRFFSKSQEVEDIWTEILPHDLLTRPRSSRICYDGKFFSYPLRLTEVLRLLGIVEATRCAWSYAKSRMRPIADPRTFEDWVTNQFGERLYGIFFKTYTEKVWGLSCKEISADWAAQRIKGLSFAAAIRAAIGRSRKTDKSGNVIKTLIESFRYPRLGPGMMWEQCCARLRNRGGRVRLGERVTACHWDSNGGVWTLTHTDAAGEHSHTVAHEVISSAPLGQLVEMITPPLSDAARAAAAALRYRDFLTVALILEDRGAFSDNWIYIHDPSVKVGRIQNYKSWSPEMVPDPTKVCYGLEYFCFEGDELWNSPDRQLITLAAGELARLGLARPEDVIDGHVVRQRRAYPIYDEGYARHVAVIAQELEARYPTVHLIGRNGMHKYDNQDHAMMTGLLCAKNIIAGKRVFDLWNVNQDAEYHEEGAVREPLA